MSRHTIGVNLVPTEINSSPETEVDYFLATNHYTRCAWAGGTCCVSFPEFCDNRQLMLFTVFTLANVLYFEEFLIHDSRGFIVLKNN
jgi:hypothetical protein